jgi:hypothetical protein
MRTDKRFDELYDSVPDGHGGVTLTLRRPVQTKDAATFGRERGQRRTRDDVLTGPEPEKRISLGSKVWTGDDGDPLVDYANYATAAFAEGCFAADRPLEAEDLDDYISRSEAHTAVMKDIRAKVASRDSSDPDPAGDRPPHERTRDARPSVLFDASRTAAYADNLKQKGEVPAAPLAATADHAAARSRGRRAMFDTSRTASYAAGLASGRAKAGA